MRKFFLLISITAIAFVMACANPAPPVSIETANAPAPAAIPADDDAPRITLADAKKDFDAGTAIFIDARGADSYKDEHIKGAINIPLADAEKRLNDIPKGKKIIAYCSWPAEHTSASLVQELRKKGFDNAFALLGGTQGWKNAGYPMEKGEKQ